MTSGNVTPPIQSLDRGLTLLETVAKSRRPVPLAELTRELGIDRSSVFRLANTLRRRGFLVQNPGSKDYVLGSAIWRLASLVPWAETLKQLAREQMVSLAGNTGETSHLAIREGREAMLIDHELTGQPVGASACTGRCVPLHCTSVGRALISDYDARRLAELFGSAPLAALTKRTVDSISALAKQCQLSRKRGFALDDQEHYEGVRCIAAPIRDASGEIIGSIGISAPAERLTKGLYKQVGQQVMQAAEEVAAKLGHPRAAENRPDESLVRQGDLAKNHQ